MYPTGSETKISELLCSRAVSLTFDNLWFLGDVHGIALHLTGVHEEDPHFHWRLEVAPFMSDESQLFLELGTDFFEPI